MRARGSVLGSIIEIRGSNVCWHNLRGPPKAVTLYLSCQENYTIFSLLLQICLPLSAITNILSYFRKPKAGSLHPGLIINKRARKKPLRYRTTSSKRNKSEHRFLGINKLREFQFTDRSTMYQIVSWPQPQSYQI